MRTADALVGAALLAFSVAHGALAMEPSARTTTRVELREQGPDLQVWSTEIEGSVVARASFCGEVACDLLLVVAPGDPREDDEQPPWAPAEDGGDAAAELPTESEDEREPGGGAAREDRVREEWTPPALLHLRLHAAGGELEVLDAALPIDEGEPLGLFDATAPEGAPRAALRLGGTLRLVPFRAEDRGASWALGEPTLRFDAGLAAHALPPGSGWIGLFEPGRLELVALDAQGSVRARESAALPFEVRRRGRSLTLESPPIRGLASNPGEPPRVVVGPQPVGSLRLRTLLVDVGAEAGAAVDTDPAHAERWSALPGPERLGGSEVVGIDGRIYLLVSTTRADKIGLLERKKLRLYELAAERTRSGLPPIAEIRTASRHWQALRWALIDATGDGLLDLVLLQPEGLSGEKLAVDLYAGRPEGGFERKEIRSLIDHTPPVWRYGDDLTGDGVPDLLLAGRGELEVWAGRRRPDQRGLLEETPRVRWSTSTALDADAEARAATDTATPTEGQRVRRTVAVEGELLLFTRSAGGRSSIDVARLGGLRAGPLREDSAGSAAPPV